MSFDLHAYAKRHRFRLRNLHDSRRCPPAWIRRRNRTPVRGYTGSADRCDAIVGRYGYIFAQDGRLELYMHFKSDKGVKRYIPQIVAAGGAIQQVGVGEIGAWLPVERIDVAARLIRVSRLSPGGNFARSPRRTAPAGAGSR